MYPTTDPERVKEARVRLDAITATLPHTTVDAASGRVVFRAAKRPYAYLVDNEHRSGVVAVYVRAEDGEALTS